MNNQNRNNFSLNTKEYLETYYDILDTMIHNMTSAELDDSISHNFITTMIPHHMAAIEMSENILKYTNVEKLQSIAQNIITEQTQSIENMQEIIDCCNMVKNTERELCRYQSQIDKITQTMFTRMRNARSTNCINCNFLREMIPHHRGAVSMASTALSFNICPQLKPILKAIISSQQKGIIQMQHLFRALRCR